MRSFEARDLLLAIAGALREHPPSFTFEVFSAQGSSTEQVQAHASPVAKVLDEQARAAVLKAAHDIDLIASEVTADRPDRGYIERLVEGLPEPLVGAVVPRLVAAILAGQS